MVAFVEMDEKVSIQNQLEDTAGPVILINKFTVKPDEAEQSTSPPLEEEAALALSSKLDSEPFCASARNASSASIANRAVGTITLIGLIEFLSPVSNVSL